MQRFSAAAATVALVSTDAFLIGHVESLLADDTTTVVVHDAFDDLHGSLPASGLDVIVVDDRVEHEASHQIRLLRRRSPLLHIVYMSARDEQRSIELLHSGADDAIICSSPTLVARLQAATRRARATNAGARIAIGDIVFDREARRVWCAGREVELTPHEYGIIDCLFWNTPRPVGVDTLSDFVWGDLANDSRRSLVQTYVSYVRKKLAHSKQVAIRFARGAGYSFYPRGADQG